MKYLTTILAILALPALSFGAWRKTPLSPDYPTNSTPAVGDAIALWDAGTNTTQNIFLSTLDLRYFDRANHTGTQLMSTISDAGSLALLNGITTTQITNSTILDEDISGAANIQLSKLATNPLARANHTGTQLMSTISNAGSLATLNAAPAGTLTGTSLASNVVTSSLTSLGNIDTFSATEAYISSVLEVTGSQTWNIGTAFSYGNAATSLAHRTALGLVVGTDVQAFDTDLGVIAGLVDPNADRILFWDDSAGAYTHLTLGTNLSITGTTLNATGGGSFNEAGDYTPTGTWDFTDATITLPPMTIGEFNTNSILFGEGLAPATPSTGSFAVYAKADGILYGKNDGGVETALTNSAIVEFEGSVVDNFETTLTVENPTADRTWTLPNVSDTVVGLDAVQTLTNKTINGVTIDGVTFQGTDHDFAEGSVNYFSGVTFSYDTGVAATHRTALGLAIGTDVQAYDADLGVIAGLADPNADRILFWDDSASSYAYLTAGSGLTITGTTISASGGGSVGTDTIWNVAGDTVYGTGSDTATRLPIGTANQLYQVNGSATAPEWTSAPVVSAINTTTLEFEGSSPDTNETTLAVVDPTADRTITLPNATGNVALAEIVTKVTAASYTIGTTDSRELYGGTIYVTGAATITIPAVATGASFTVITIGANAVSVDPNAADLVYLDGTALADGDKVTNTSTAGDIAVFTYFDGTGWYCSSNGWTDGN